jgi:hypothetical protein
VYPDGTAYDKNKDAGKGEKKDRNPAAAPPRPARQPKHPINSHINDKSGICGDLASKGCPVDRDEQHRRANAMVKDHSLERSLSSDSLIAPGTETDLTSQQRRLPNEIRASPPVYLRSREDGDDATLGLRSGRRLHTPKVNHTGPHGSASTAMAAMHQAQDKGREKERDHGGAANGDFDVDRAFRRNRRKWELLEGMASSDDSGFGECRCGCCTIRP